MQKLLKYLTYPNPTALNSKLFIEYLLIYQQMFTFIYI